MTVPASPYKISYTYTGTGSATVFPYTFRIFKAADLLVTKIDTDGTITILALTTDYAVDGVLVTTGGNVTLVVALTNGQQITILRDPASEQDTQLVEGGAYSAVAIMNALDLLTMQIQSLKDLSNRSPSAPANETPTDGAFTFPPVADRKGKVLGFDATTGDPIAEFAAAAAGALLIAENLADLDDAPTARTNLGLGTAATQDAADFDAAGTAAGVPAYEVITYNANVVLDLSRANDYTGFCSLTGAISVTLSGSANGRNYSLLLKADGTNRALAVPGAWKSFSTVPANVLANKRLAVSISCVGGEVWASYTPEV